MNGFVMDVSGRLFLAGLLLSSGCAVAGQQSGSIAVGDEDLAGALERAPMNLNAADIPDEAFPRIKNGYLWANGKRLKLWGSQGKLGTDPGIIDVEVGRFRKLGFNLFRPINLMPYPFVYDKPKFEKGSVRDIQDYYFAAISASGGYLWLDLLNGFRVMPEHADLADDPAIGREEWLSSMEQIVGTKASDHQRGSHGPQSGLMYWDLRSREAYMRYID
ncbi:MAG: hypothetical protein ABFR33_00815, partial [Verrucomicrobiota bacterium]